AVPIVARLEVVDVDQEHHAATVALRSGGLAALQLARRGTAVEQPGQAVDGAEATQARGDATLVPDEGGNQQCEGDEGDDQGVAQARGEGHFQGLDATLLAQPQQFLGAADVLQPGLQPRQAVEAAVQACVFEGAQLFRRRQRRLPVTQCLQRRELGNQRLTLLELEHALGQQPARLPGTQKRLFRRAGRLRTGAAGYWPPRWDLRDRAGAPRSPAAPHAWQWTCRLRPWPVARGVRTAPAAG